MKDSTWMGIGVVGLLVVAVGAVLIGRGSGPSAPTKLPTPETGGPVIGEAGRGTPTGKTSAPTAKKAKGKPTPRPTPKTAVSRPRPEPKRQLAQVYRNPELKVTLEKPRSTDWVMSDKKSNFRGVPHPQKVLEIRRSPQDGSKRFAHMELYVATVPPGGSAEAIASDIESHKGITKWAEEGKIAVVNERAITIGGRSMVRRVLRVEHKGRTMQLLSLRATRADKVYVLIGLTDPDNFAAIEAEFDQVFTSLRIE